jgi:hypothetical protein
MLRDVAIALVASLPFAAGCAVLSGYDDLRLSEGADARPMVDAEPFETSVSDAASDVPDASLDPDATLLDAADGDLGSVDARSDAAADADVAPSDTSSDTDAEAGTPLRGLFVAVGGGGRRVVSTDGIEWRHDQHDVTTDGHEYNLHDVGGGGAKIVAVGWRTKTSVDGRTWVDRGLEPGWLANVVYAENKWVAVGGYGRRAVSGDGFTWQGAAGAVGTAMFVGLAHGNVSGGRFVAVGEAGARIYSDDGISWSLGSGDPCPETLSDLAFGNGRYVAIGGAHVLWSTDGNRFTAAEKPPGVPLDAIVFAAGRFLAVGAGGSYTSADGASWSAHGAGVKGHGRLAHGAGAYVAISWNEIFRSVDGRTWAKVFGGVGAGFSRVRYVRW